MKYVPKLIAEEHRVLPDYFKQGSIGSKSNKNTFVYTASLLGAILFFLLAVAFINHVLPALLFGLTGFVMLPAGHRLIEKNLRFKFTTPIKATFVAMLLISAVPIANHYQSVDEKVSLLLKEKAEKEERERIATEKAAQQKEQQQRDSLNFYLTAAGDLEKTSKHESALNMLNYAAAFAPGGVENSEIVQTKNLILRQQAAALIKTGAYEQAIPKLSAFIETQPVDADLLYQRALCLSKTGKTKEAVDDLKIAMEYGSEAAEKLHEQINPIRKRIIGYITRCCDGSTSNAKGRGACSWHGGVCNWNEPVYEEYRKY